jgi:flavin reductase (DIM6/NTAB) family NADH-FMN oxidoreductase RutF
MTNLDANKSQIDAALRLVDRELWIITAAHESSRGGLLATWVTSASIDPERPMLLAGISPNHFTAELVQSSRAFAAHLLRPDQMELAWNFANGSGRDRDKLAGLEVKTNETNSPILTNCLAWFDCRVFANYNAGDRLFFWADIVGCSGAPAQRVAEQPVAATTSISRVPLREHQFIQSLTPDQRQTLLSDRKADILKNRPFHEQWRQSINP